MRLGEFTTLTFDVYGTLIDWESGITAALRPLTDRLDPSLSRDQILEAHAFHESSQQAATPSMRYRDLLAVVYKRLAEEWGLAASWQDCVTYGQSVRDWPAFADSADALAALKQHFKLVVLSNVDNQSFAFSNEKMGCPFDAVFTAEDMGSYKPTPRNFDYMLERLERRGIEKRQILHVAESMFHDHAPAKGFGLASCWIYRRHEKEGFGATMPPAQMPKPDFTYHSMAELVAAHAAEIAG
ncbi:MAG: haloacid dehalogenase type II [Rhizobiales bacterium]|nr:haloacid dehalogenase type II [Hyphomicrobiales bacterium]